MAGGTNNGNAAFRDFTSDFADVTDPLERRRLALEKIDNASFSWYHVRAICVGGVGFLTDAYDIFAINLAVTMMAYVYWEDAKIPSSTSTLLKVSTSVGTVIGQLGFGRLADMVGRHRIYGSELIIMITATIFQCTIGHSYAIGFVPLLTFWRIIMGIGIGADYPTSSVITSEFATTKYRGAIIGAVFANQGWGQLLAGIVSVVCVRAWKDDLVDAKTALECTDNCRKAIDQMWRVLIGFGAIPGSLALYYRLTIPASPRYQLNELEQAAEKELEEEEYNMKVTAITGYSNGSGSIATSSASPDKNENQAGTLKEFYDHFKQWKYGKILIGTAGSWFMLDVAFYGLGLNTAVILQAIGFSSDANIYETLYNVCSGNLILICAGSIPGYWFTVFTVDIIGRKIITTCGFIIMTIIFCLIGFAYEDLGEKGLFALYVLAQFFENFGPNATTYIISAECFPSKYRSTAHGISSASGKLGAIVAQCALGTLIDHGCSSDDENCFLPHVMEIFALFMFIGIFTSLLLPETKRQTLESLAERLHGEIDPNRIAREKSEMMSAKGNNDSNSNSSSTGIAYDVELHRLNSKGKKEKDTTFREVHNIV
ncbi:hypothetical protein PACTADRAFT_40831 [Pachysolen tannophilus NRRL Y-2460]|uniref:Major facilitator superfamily (MFS) profile domain-containing protein n=1 Tax=Pachysolen tannophilus NRRL Y-2460 TaxID=669874 RepID=A0A1E4TXG3_PACTA|nr:hypothetical protein PACTADRAFT_40831 [Pachysolen tannophilus NRRL Y-2460]